MFRCDGERKGEERGRARHVDRCIFGAVRVIDAAWDGWQGKINAQNVSDTCAGTGYQASPQTQMGLARFSGDGHAQTPVLWIAAEILVLQRDPR
jgi:hypothetical protein